MVAQKWNQNAAGYLELVDPQSGVVIMREKKRKPPRTMRSGGRGPGRPSNADLALAEKNKPIRKLRLYEYDQVVAELICAAISAGENFRTLDPKHCFPPYHELQRWRLRMPEFDNMVIEAKETWAFLSFENSIRKGQQAVATGAVERRGRPLGSKNKRPPALVIGEPIPAPEINWDDIPMVIERFGSWEAAMRHKELTRR